MNQAHLDYLASEAWAESLRRDLVPWMDRVADLGDDVLEVGPGPGLTTDLLRARADRVTAVELDEALATALRDRLAGTNVEVVHGDAGATGLPTGRFSAATCFSMLHHVPSVEAQDTVLAELARVLRPGAPLLAVDARDSELLAAFHEDDVFVPLGEDTLVERLRVAGFAEVDVVVEEHELRLVARTPARPSPGAG